MLGSKARESRPLLLRPNTITLCTGAQEPHGHGSPCLLSPERSFHAFFLQGRGLGRPTWEQLPLLPSISHSLLMYHAANALVHGLLLLHTQRGKENQCNLNFSSPAGSLVNCCSKLSISYCSMILKQHQGKLKSHRVHFTG